MRPLDDLQPEHDGSGWPCPECLVIFADTRHLALHLEEDHD